MKTLKDLFEENQCYMTESEKKSLNRKTMVYLAKYFEMPRDNFTYGFLRNLWRSVGYKNTMPHHVYISVDDGTLMICHVTKKSGLYKTLLELGFQE